jgi:hypothetical protein
LGNRTSAFSIGSHRAEFTQQTCSHPVKKLDDTPASNRYPARKQVTPSSAPNKRWQGSQRSTKAGSPQRK